MTISAGKTSSNDSENAIMNEYKGGFGSAGSSAGPSSAQVYMGTKTVSGLYGKNEAYLSPAAAAQLGQRKVNVPVTASKAEAYNLINSMNSRELATLQAKMIYSGMIKDEGGFLEMQTKWKKLVDAAYGLNQAGQKISPFDILDSYLGKGPLGGKGGLGAGGAAQPLWQTQFRGGRKFLVNTQTGEVKYQGPRFETTYNKTIDLTDPVTAKAIATSVFQQLMHRDPGKGELGGFSDALRTAEQASPVVTQTTTEYDMNSGEPIGQSSTQSGGLSADAKSYMAQQRVKKTKEYASTQAATTYMDALESAIMNNPFGSI